MHGPLTAGLSIRVRGQVQGVGFRPFIWQLARQFGLRGDVCNDPEGVWIRVAGNDLDAFANAIRAEAPPLARIDAVETAPCDVPETLRAFEIAASKGEGSETRITPDAATCADCLADIRGSDPRRAGYAFTNCTHCGPRFTIINGLPYDRARTSMAAFDMCPDCAAEYGDPADRRFHAQPVACALCGPRLWFETAGKRTDDDVLVLAAERLKAGDVLAIKGLGGFHLCCDALNADAVALLRSRKQRPSKPLALMDSLDRIANYAELTEAARTRLTDPASPIVLLARGGADVPDGIAPGIKDLGVMLPYTPLHHLLLDAFRGPLVMTSGNVSGEPQVIANEEAREKLGRIVDGFVMHDRDIRRRLDDSVERLTREGPTVLRHARGRVPQTLPLPDGFDNAPQTVAFGGHLKSAICLIKNGQALLSHHLGDLDELLTWEEFLKADRDYAELFDHAPDVFACDLHEGYRSSQHAVTRAGSHDPVRIQHHHAHLAACMAENGWPLQGGKVVGLVLDGLGLGTDGTVWGGEVLIGDYLGFDRVGHLAPAPLVGGDAAQREPWRNAVMRLDRVELDHLADELFGDKPLLTIRQAAKAGLNAVPSSSAGRLFDAFAAVLGIVPDAQSYEGEAAMRLESLARQGEQEARDKWYAMTWVRGALDDAPLWTDWARDRAADVPRDVMAWRFHRGVAEAFAGAARHAVDTGAAEAVALSGGCLQNPLLQTMIYSALGDLPVLLHHKVPANDGGLALGQAVVAAAQSMSEPLTIR